ncbi:hypothetical protein BDV59DRAFT_202493 [Aspergillus ambiguus]|uniref:nucleoside 2-deoxyribosyltransferase domain-containing protein n=1 Tax=Aspergillus ambiguus TaxID=176160 RepID=UPI003CCD7C45
MSPQNQVIHAPSNETPHGIKSIFLAGTVSKVDPSDWRDTLCASLVDVPVTIYNPSRADWDSSWREDIHFAPYREQVEWELDKQDQADIVIIYFHPATQASISLLELGLCARVPGKAIIVCPEGYWKRGNVEIGQSPDSTTRRVSPTVLESESNFFTDDAIMDMAWHTDPFCAMFQQDSLFDTFQPNLASDMDPCIGTSFCDLLLGNMRCDGGWEELIMTGRIGRASEAFKSSLWYSIPDQGPRNLSSIPGEEDPEALIEDFTSSVPQRFTLSTRDNLLVSLVLFAYEQFPECLQSLRTGFPSPSLLNTLVHLFLKKQDRKVDPWIHAASFQPNSSNLELTAIIVAASALGTPSKTLRQLGTNLRRLLRRVILNKLEDVHEGKHNLQLYQALLLCLELDLWYGDDECLRRAGRFSSIIATFLRQDFGDGEFDLIYPPVATDDTSETAEKWSKWVNSESYKRLATRFCVYDNQLSMTLGIKASTTFSEYRVSAPLPRDLWLARNPTEWKRIYLSHQPNFIPRVIDLLYSMPTISAVQGFLDRGLAMKLLFHLIGGQITEYHLSAETLQKTNETQKAVIGRDTLQSRKRDLEITIRAFDQVFSREICASHIGGFLVSYLKMSLKVSIVDIEVLAGKAGEHKSQEIYRVMKEWPETTDAREAIWHAGQILRLFKLLQRLTSFQIIMAYHAGLVLFAYSVLSRVQGRFPAPWSESVLCLNDTSSVHTEGFISSGSFEPILRSDFRGTDRVTAPLLATEEAVDIISEIILNRSCTFEELSPRLVNGLVKLLRDLASAIQISRVDPSQSEFEIDPRATE